MFKKFFSLLGLFFICSIGWSQKVLVTVFMQPKITRASSDTIYHTVQQRLTWKDFKGIPDTKHFGGAVTSSGYAFDADIKVENKIIYLNVGVYVFFIKSQSWKKPRIESDYHLLHEQLHFDITRLGAENFIKQLLNAKFTKDNYNQVLESVFDKSYNENIVQQQQYDKETRHSILTQQQHHWNVKIADEMKKLQ